MFSCETQSYLGLLPLVSYFSVLGRRNTCIDSYLCIYCIQLLFLFLKLTSVILTSGFSTDCDSKSVFFFFSFFLFFFRRKWKNIIVLVYFILFIIKDASPSMFVIKSHFMVHCKAWDCTKRTVFWPWRPIEFERFTKLGFTSSVSVSWGLPFIGSIFHTNLSSLFF